MNNNYCKNCGKWNAEIFRLIGKPFCSQGCEDKFQEKDNVELPDSLKDIFNL